MLLNNFKPLVLFGGNTSFINVLGKTVSINNVLQQTYTTGIINGHSVNGITRSFNYTTTTTSNSYKDEQTLYSWANIVCTSTSWAATDRYNGFTLFVGSGNTPVTLEDYKLENRLILDVVAALCSHDTNGRVIVSRTFKNNSDEDVIVNEVGCYLFAQVPNSTYYLPLVMIGRRVLRNPVIIPPGEIYTFNYSIDMSKISFEEADDC